MSKLDFNTCEEILLFSFIDEAGAFIWHMNHEMAHGRIPKEKHLAIDKDILRVRKEQEEAVSSTKRFNIDPFGENGNPTEEYWVWFKKWKSYLQSLNKNQLDTLQALINQGKDLSEFHPDKKE